MSILDQTLQEPAKDVGSYPMNNGKPLKDLNQDWPYLQFLKFRLQMFFVTIPTKTRFTS